MDRSAEEWVKQADYDMETAQAMSDAGRYFYAVFMCHLAIEKALKGLFADRLGELPPKTHNLVYLLKRMGTLPPGDVGRFIVKVNEASVTTRYPESLEALQRAHSAATTARVLSQARETLQWIKKQFWTP